MHEGYGVVWCGVMDMSSIYPSRFFSLFLVFSSSARLLGMRDGWIFFLHVYACMMDGWMFHRWHWWRWILYGRRRMYVIDYRNEMDQRKFCLLA